MWIRLGFQCVSTTLETIVSRFPSTTNQPSTAVQRHATTSTATPAEEYFIIQHKHYSNRKSRHKASHRTPIAGYTYPVLVFSHSYFGIRVLKEESRPKCPAVHSTVFASSKSLVNLVDMKKDHCNLLAHVCLWRIPQSFNYM